MRLPGTSSPICEEILMPRYPHSSTKGTRISVLKFAKIGVNISKICRSVKLKKRVLFLSEPVHDHGASLHGGPGTCLSLSRVATRQGKVREKLFFSRSGKCQGILKFVREKMNFEKCHGKLTCVREKLNFQVYTPRFC